MEIEIDDKILKHKFNLVTNEFPIKTDGILGMDFFYKNSCRINYDMLNIEMVIKGDITIIPIEIDTAKIYNIIMPPRSKMIVPINIKINEDSVVCNKEIENGVFVANTIIPKDGYRHVKILNTLEIPIQLQKLNITTIPLQYYNVHI